MKSLLLALIFVPIFGYSQNLPVGFDPQTWQKLVQTTIEKGNALFLDNDQEIRTLKKITPDNSQVSHQAEYFSTLGQTDSNGKYQASEVSVVSENWQLKENNIWLIDQWIYRVSISGELLGIMHDEMRETTDGQYLDGQNFPTGEVDDPATIALWGKKLNQWFEFLKEFFRLK